jgi:hypothetical protein
MLSRIGKNESGQMLVIAALSLTVLMAFMALATDMGVLFRAKRNVQIAADAAAAAGALDFHYNATNSSATTAAQAASSANGFTNGSNGVVVSVSFPAASMFGATGTGFVRATVSEPNPTLFFRLVNFSTVTVAATAVAGPQASAGCVWTLTTSGTDVNNTGSGTVDLPSCIFYDDSSSSNALTNVGSGTITAKKIGIVGNYSNVGSGSINPTPTTGMTYVSDPLASLQPPTIPTSTGSGCQPAQNFSGSGNFGTLSAGCYDGISLNGSGTLTLNAGNYVINGNISVVGSANITLGAGNYIINGSLTNTGSGTMTLGAGNYTISSNFSNTGTGTLNLGAGEYIVEGNLQLTGSGPMSGTGVSFYTEGQTQVTGSGSVNISAPTSGPENGILFFQSRSDSQAMTITGSSSMNLEGIVYAPDAALSFTGSGSGTMYTDLVVGSLSFTGSTSFQNYASLNSNTPLSSMVMVE